MDPTPLNIFALVLSVAFLYSCGTVFEHALDLACYWTIRARFGLTHKKRMTFYKLAGRLVAGVGAVTVANGFTTAATDKIWRESGLPQVPTYLFVASAVTLAAGFIVEQWLEGQAATPKHIQDIDADLSSELTLAEGLNKRQLDGYRANLDKIKNTNPGFAFFSRRVSLKPPVVQMLKNLGHNEDLRLRAVSRLATIQLMRTFAISHPWRSIRHFLPLLTAAAIVVSYLIIAARAGLTWDQFWSLWLLGLLTLSVGAALSTFNLWVRTVTGLRAYFDFSRIETLCEMKCAELQEKIDLASAQKTRPREPGILRRALQMIW